MYIYIYIYIQDHIGSLRVASVVLFRISLHVFRIMYLCVELVLAAPHHPKMPLGKREFWYTLLRIREPFCAIWDPFAAPFVARRRKKTKRHVHNSEARRARVIKWSGPERCGLQRQVRCTAKDHHLLSFEQTCSNKLMKDSDTLFKSIYWFLVSVRSFGS